MAKLPPLPDSQTNPNQKQSLWEKVVVSTPIILTVVATILAGLSSSELNLAQYSRSLAAQMQSKASDQWNYFQAKKLRAEQCRETMMILQSIGQSPRLDATAMRRQANELAEDMENISVADATANASVDNRGEIAILRRYVLETKQIVGQLNQSTTQPDGSVSTDRSAAAEFPRANDEPIGDQAILDLMAAIGSSESDTQTEQEAGRIDQASLDRAIAAANKNSIAFSDAIRLASDTMDEYAKSAVRISANVAGFNEAAAKLAGPDAPDAHKPLDDLRESASRLGGALAVASQEFDGVRYDHEAKYCQTLAQLYEIQVRKDGFTSERHRVRSRQFFYGMLAAQAGVTIATFALAVRRRSVLWGLAASAGLAAITFAAYVYVFV
jgi:hypothetical protein